jgi:hypothetical protein
VNHEELFVKTIQDLQDKIVRNDEYSLLRAAGLLRHLLNDGVTLISLANRNINLKLRFIVNAELAPENFLLAKWVDISNVEGKTCSVNLDGFTGRPILTIIDIRFTVLDFIKATSHFKGGVHSYTAKDPNDKILSVLDENVFRDMGIALKTIKGIAEVTMNGVEPLVSAINGRTLTGRF